MKKIALYISFLFNPLLFALITIFLLILFNQTNEKSSLLKFFLVASFFSTILPLFFILTLKKFGFTKDNNEDERLQRPIPFLLTSGSFMFGFFSCKNLGPPK
jgi:hypothetical protein